MRVGHGIRRVNGLGVAACQGTAEGDTDGLADEARRRSPEPDMLGLFGRVLRDRGNRRNRLMRTAHNATYVRTHIMPVMERGFGRVKRVLRILEVS